MKTHQYILLTTILFITLFYGEEMGLNFGILGVAYALLTLFNTPEGNRTRTFLLLFVTGVLSSIAFAWFGDFASFLAVIMSVFLLAFKSKSRDLKSLFVIPVFAVNFFTFVYRIFKTEDWLPKYSTSSSVKKLISVFLIPAVFILAFFGVYTLGSEHFATLFTGFEFNFKIWEFIAISFLGFFLAFNFWNFRIENFIFRWNHFLKNDFVNEEKTLTPTATFLDLDSERRSGMITFLALIVLLLIFIITFNYEQFVEIQKSPNQLSAETHDRVNAVILSIVMAVLLIMFYFKGSFNFDEKAKSLKILAKIWLFLNAVLVISAVAKNTEYILNYGLTYKRLGVYTFLFLCFIGLFYTFLKIRRQKTNAYLFNNMVWYFYGTVLVCSYFNWGNLATAYNLNEGKGDVKFLQTLNFNHALLRKHFPNEKSVQERTPEEMNDTTLLSKILYYETLKK